MRTLDPARLSRGFCLCALATALCLIVTGGFSRSVIHLIFIVSAAFSVIFGLIGWKSQTARVSANCAIFLASVVIAVSGWSLLDVRARWRERNEYARFEKGMNEWRGIYPGGDKAFARGWQIIKTWEHGGDVGDDMLGEMAFYGETGPDDPNGNLHVGPAYVVIEYRPEEHRSADGYCDAVVYGRVGSVDNRNHVIYLQMKRANYHSLRCI